MLGRSYQGSNEYRLDFLCEISEMKTSKVLYKGDVRLETEEERNKGYGGHIKLDLTDPTYNTMKITILLEDWQDSDENVMGKLVHELK